MVSGWCIMWLLSSWLILLPTFYYFNSLRAFSWSSFDSLDWRLKSLDSTAVWLHIPRSFTLWCSPTQGAVAWSWLSSVLLNWAGQFWKVPGWGWGWQAGGAGVLESHMFSWIRKEDVVDRRHPSAHSFKKLHHPLPPKPTHYLTPTAIF